MKFFELAKYAFDGVRPKSAHHTWSLAVMFLALLLAPPVCEAQVVNEPSLVLSGSTEFASYQRDGITVNVKQTEEFTLTLGESGRWHLSLKTTIFKDGHYELSFDGTNIFSVRYSDRMWGDKDGKFQVIHEFPSLEKGRHLASITPGALPANEYPTTRFAWLALASANYLRNQKDTSIPAVWLGWSGFRNEIMAYGYRSQFEALSRDSIGAPSFTAVVAPRLPEIGEVKAFDAPRTREEFDRIQTQIKQFKTLNPGLEAAEYQVHSTTNVYGYQIPLHYELQVYWPGVGVSETNKALAQEYVGKVSSIAKGKSIRIRPPAVGSISVNDYRFHNDFGKFAYNGMRYHITDGQWKERNDKELVTQFNASRFFEKRYDETGRQLIRYGTILMCALLVLGSLWKFARRRPSGRS